MLDARVEGMGCARGHGLSTNDGIGLVAVRNGNSFPLVGREVIRHWEHEHAAERVVIATDDQLRPSVQVQISDVQIEGLANVYVIQNTLDQLQIKNRKYQIVSQKTFFFKN